MPYEVVSSVFVAINGVPLSTPAWECLNPLALRVGPATRGQDRVIPGAAGVRPHARRGTIRRVSLDVLVLAARDWDGEPYPSLTEGLDANLMHLRTNVTDPDGATIPTAVLTLPDGSTIAGAVHVEDFTWVPIGRDAMASLELSLPYGALTEVGS